MDNDVITENEAIEIDLIEIWKQIKKNMRLIILSAILLGIIASLFTMFFMEKQYASSTRIYLTPKVTDQGYVDSTTVNSNNVMVNNYVSILKGKTILAKVANQLGLASIGEISAGLHVSNEAETQIINVSMTTNDPVKSKDIAETLTNVFFAEMKESLNITKMTVLDEAQINYAPVSPSIRKNAMLGIVGGVALSCGYVFLKYLLDKRLRNRTEAEHYLGLPVLAEIPYYEN